jgi:hypothetical protein
MAPNTIFFPTPYLIVFGIIVVSVEGTLVDADLTLYASLRVSSY